MANANLDVNLQASRLRSGWLLIGVFTASIFLSAALLFSVQPMFAKMVLPLLGGSSSVWNTAMVFFQLVLLGGYIYAHVISKYLTFGMQVIVHGLVLGLGCFFLPLSIANGWTPPETGAQAFWLIGLFAVSVGVPFFAISANAPLLQRWFSRTDDKDADDPYFLYSASNAGSLLSLCLYPVVFEPMLRLREQTGLWAWGYAILIIFIICAGYIGTLRQNNKTETIIKSAVQPLKTSISQRLIWISLAFIPSSLMLGVTSHMTHNIASAPFLWIIPLALYLLTFIVAFAKRPIISSKTLGYLTLVAIVSALMFGMVLNDNLILSIIISLISYFIIALTCHMKLVETRPETDHLTEFYIWMSLGGVIGGAFNALLAPVIFSTVYEYILVLGAASFVSFKFHPDLKGLNSRYKKLFQTLLIATFMLTVLYHLKVTMMISCLLPGLFLVYKLERLSAQPRFTMLSTLSIISAMAFVVPLVGQKNVLMDRSFFGILGVSAKTTPHGVIHEFSHGDTLHNFQFQNPELKATPLAYYSKSNSFDRGLSFARSQSITGDLDVAMIGLGAGAMACYERAQDNWVYFEIDPAVVDMAKNPEFFSYMEECSYVSDVRIGDARIKLDRLSKNSQDYIIIDAFSSDSIPAHLLTVEAMDLYLSRLKPDGLLFFHTSNRVMDVSSVVTNLAESAGLDSRYIEMTDFPDSKYPGYDSKSSAVLVGTAGQMIDAEAFDDKWQKRRPSPDVGLWSDDYSHIIGTLKARYKNNAKIIP